MVVIKGDQRLDGATDVLFGSQSAPFKVEPDGTISATAPIILPGSTVPVTVVFNGQALPSTWTHSYPIAEMDVMGPLQLKYAFVDSFCPDRDWFFNSATGRRLAPGAPGAVFCLRTFQMSSRIITLVATHRCP
jgi:hypothetical protein